MRGTLAFGHDLLAAPGIIPAYAGNTPKWPCSFRRFWDHPRVCGEHHHPQFLSTYPQGSSPRMRGTPLSDAGHGIQSGIIPAYAGNTSISPATSATNRDHPRVCGEHIFNAPARVELPGSSPRMRGTHMTVQQYNYIVGIIPAYAGNTKPRGFLMSRYWDHPRVCGEHDSFPSDDFIEAGSSPRMRGTRKRDR